MYLHENLTLWNLASGEYLHTLRRDRPYERLDITGIRGLSETQKTTLRALGAVEEATFLAHPNLCTD